MFLLLCLKNVEKFDLLVAPEEKSENRSTVVIHPVGTTAV